VAAAGNLARTLHKHVVVPERGGELTFTPTDLGLRIGATAGWHVIGPDGGPVTDPRLFELFHWL